MTATQTKASASPAVAAEPAVLSGMQIEPVRRQLSPREAGSALLQRKCACGGDAGIGGSCPECSKRRLQRRAAGGFQGTRAPAIVHDVLRAPGAPLDAAARSFFESRFGHDFRQVRVHADAQAAESARAVNAQAYTVGDDIVFANGRYAPHTEDGRKLLGHELTHVVQQSGFARNDGDIRIGEARGTAEREAEALGDRAAAGQPSQVAHHTVPRLQGAWSWRRAGLGALLGGAIGGLLGGFASIWLGPAAFYLGLGLGALAGGLIGGLTGRRQTTTTMQGPTGPNDCRVEHHQKIWPAIQRSLRWLGTALGQLTAFIARPAMPELQPVRAALTRHFRTDQPQIAQHVRGRLDRINTEMTARQDFRVECHDNSDLTCGAANAYVTGNNNELLVFCPIFFNRFDDNTRSESIIHEMAHSLLPGVHISDHAYRENRLYDPTLTSGAMTTAEALTNAESYGAFARELGAGSVVGMTAPVDRIAGCPPAWAPLVRGSLARGERWNRNAQMATADRNPDWLRRADWNNLRNAHLGGADIPRLDAAKAVYDAVEQRLHQPISIACDTAPGGACGAATLYRLDGDTIHLCPAWQGLPSDGDRTQALLEALYGLHARVVDPAMRANYARLARDTTARLWRAPTLQDVLSGGT